MNTQNKTLKPIVKALKEKNKAVKDNKQYHNVLKDFGISDIIISEIETERKENNAFLKRNWGLRE